MDRALVAYSKHLLVQEFSPKCPAIKRNMSTRIPTRIPTNPPRIPPNPTRILADSLWNIFESLWDPCGIIAGTFRRHSFLGHSFSRRFRCLYVFKNLCFYNNLYVSNAIFTRSLTRPVHFYTFLERKQNVNVNVNKT